VDQKQHEQETLPRRKRVQISHGESLLQGWPKRANSERTSCLGAIEGTRTPTPLPVHGPEPCASANSATMAILNRKAAAASRPPSQEDHLYSTAARKAVKPTQTATAERTAKKSCAPEKTIPTSRSSKSWRSEPSIPGSLFPQLPHISEMSLRRLRALFPRHRCGSR
jgi:hypothetical protein